MGHNGILTPGQWQRATKQALELSRRMQAAGEKDTEQGSDSSPHEQDVSMKAPVSQK